MSAADEDKVSSLVIAEDAPQEFHNQQHGKHHGFYIEVRVMCGADVNTRHSSELKVTLLYAGTVLLICSHFRYFC